MLNSFDAIIFKAQLQNYFKVHKKILCQPLSGFFRNSESARLTTNLCKAQSCSSIIRDGIHHPSETTLSTSSSSIAKNSSKLDEKILGDRESFKNRLNFQFTGSGSNMQENICNTEKHALLDYIDDNFICSSKC